MSKLVNRSGEGAEQKENVVVIPLDLGTPSTAFGPEALKPLGSGGLPKALRLWSRGGGGGKKKNNLQMFFCSLVCVFFWHLPSRLAEA